MEDFTFTVVEQDVAQSTASAVGVVGLVALAAIIVD